MEGILNSGPVKAFESCLTGVFGEDLAPESKIIIVALGALAAVAAFFILESIIEFVAVVLIGVVIFVAIRCLFCNDSSSASGPSTFSPDFLMGVANAFAAANVLGDEDPLMPGLGRTQQYQRPSTQPPHHTVVGGALQPQRLPGQPLPPPAQQRPIAQPPHHTVVGGANQPAPLPGQPKPPDSFLGRFNLFSSDETPQHHTPVGGALQPQRLPGQPVPPPTPQRPIVQSQHHTSVGGVHQPQRLPGAPTPPQTTTGFDFSALLNAFSADPPTETRTRVGGNRGGLPGQPH